MNTVEPEDWTRLTDMAGEVVTHAYAPYSKFHVGAALLTESGRAFAGCNVENLSYGLTICAERSAVFAAVAAEGSSVGLRAVVVVCDPVQPCSPCGACRQVLLEFGADAPVRYRGEEGWVTRSVRELLPDAFASF